MCRVFSCLARLALSLIFIAITMPCVALGANEIGKVIMYTPGATVQRDGKTEPLALHAGIRVSDTLQTDAGGRVKVLFNDDSSVSLGPNTTMDMNEYADAGSKSAFSVNVPQGMIRAITGKITEQNPSGFKVTSPEATVGIRGTIVTMQVHRGQGGRMRTTVYVENTLRRVLVNGDDVPSGNKWIHEGGASRQERISSDDRRHIGKTMAFRGGNGVAAAAPEAMGEGGRRRSTGSFAAARSDTFLLPDTQLKDTALSTQTLGDSLGGSLLQASAPMGHVSGTLQSATWGPSIENSTFSFDVNLASGQIANGRMNIDTQHPFGDIPPNPVGAVARLSGGTGQADASGFVMNGASGMGRYYLATGYPVTLRGPPVPMSGSVSGGTNLRSAPSGTTFPVNFTVVEPGVSGFADIGSGTGSIAK